ncbi:MAG: hypothetical protein L3J75_05435 [Methylococcaceae bacterium]|nr:hypothetical protein [Methylococcaceae bacterium]
MSFVLFLIIYLIVAVVISYLVTSTFSRSQLMPDRRKSDRRQVVRSGFVDRRTSLDTVNILK